MATDAPSRPSQPVAARSTRALDELGREQHRHLVHRGLAGAIDDEFRPDVEGLRAVAVVLVVVFHMQVGALSGGFIGVDVFFVLSGFLITRLLLRELAATGTISLPAFWARRARRLLPASCLVLVVTVVLGRWMLPPVALRDLGVDAMASGAFVVNFVFADRLGDYFGAQLGQVSPSPLLHFWSLAVEEQFYLVWPATILLIARRPRQLRRLLVLVVSLLVVAGFAVSAWMTRRSPTWAFYMLPPRLGELLVGALLAIAGPAFRVVSPRGRAAAAWFGLAAIGYAAVRYDETVAFPGTATLIPVLGTALVIIAGGSGASVAGPSPVLSLAPLQWIGRHSYAIYLWHWPALVLAEAHWGPLSIGQRGIAVAVAVALSAASLRLVEDPVRHSVHLAALPQRGLVLGASLAGAAVVVGAVSIALAPALDSGTVASAPTLVTAPAATSPGSTTPGATVTTVAGPGDVDELVGTDLAALIAANQQVLAQGLTVQDVPSNLRPSLGRVYDDRPQVYADGCVNVGVDDDLHDCRYGAVGSSITVVLYGDSHAAQWFPAFERLAMANGIELVVMTKGGCPTANVSIATNTLGRTCPIWRDKVMDALAADPPDMVVVTAQAHYDNDDAEWEDGFDDTVRRLSERTSRVVVLEDNPDTRRSPAECLSDNLRSVPACTNSRENAIEAGRQAAERAVAERYDAWYVPTADWFCTPEACPVIIGDLLLFRDRDHITTYAAEWFAPLVEAAILPILQGG